MIGEGDLLQGSRITRLERENRIMKGALIAAMLLVAALFLAARFESGSRLVVKELLFTDDAGNVGAQLGSSRQGTCLHREGSAELTKADLCADKVYGAFLNLASLNPVGTAHLSSISRGESAGGWRYGTRTIHRRRRGKGNVVV
jgi:hypothetical protein